jgi:5-methylcytosine-specific restriction protein B
MAFCFTEEDFKRYVKQAEHGGRHIWHELQDQMEAAFGVPFSAAPYIPRGDRLRTLWFAPKGTPRSSWANQAQFFLARSIEKKQLTFGLMVECASPSETTKYALDPNRDGLRLIERLENDSEFARQLDQTGSQIGWKITVNEWGKSSYSPANSIELLGILKRMPEEQGWDVDIERVMTADEAIGAGEDIVNQIMGDYKAVHPLWEAVIPEADQKYLEYGTSPPPPPPPSDLHATLTNSLSAQGLMFTPWQIATFYTALQTKGFVILSGISGTGKTKLAQAFATLLPRPESIALLGVADPISDQAVYGGRQPLAYWWSYPIREDVEARLATPFRLYIYHQGQITHVHTVAEFKTQAGDDGMESPWPNITLPEEIGKIAPDDHPNWKFKTWCKVTQMTKLDHPIDLSVVRPLFGYSHHPSALRNALMPIEDPQVEPHIWIFCPVRPDWRDSKSLLGYYNPLTRTYEWTPFLRFLLRAVQSYRTGDGLAWFVILDEMNLAHVEYYFADLLSVLESGRDADGWTREPLRLAYPDDAEGNLPPRELRLPPNLYIAGTVNVDETTHAFSPKVLDRAFTLELTEANFSAYPPQAASALALTDDERQALLEQFSRNGRFACVEKAPIAAYIVVHPEVRNRLQRLNDLLRPYDLHFGYRVFDEIVAFLAAAEENDLYANLGGMEAAFDAAVLMKVLPKFHGSRGKLEHPLQAVLAWCANPENPDLASIRQELERIDSTADLEPVWGKLTFRLSSTARRAQRMMGSLYTTGFAAFG